MARLERLEVIPEDENVFERLERLLREHGLMLWSYDGQAIAVVAPMRGPFKYFTILPPPPRPTMPSAPYAEKHPPRPSSLEGRPTIPDQLQTDVPLPLELARKAVAGAVVAGLAGALLGLELFFAGIDLLNVLFGTVRS